MKQELSYLMSFAFSFMITLSIHGQGSFVNLDFEAANVPPNTPDGTQLTETQAFPGWTIISGLGPSYNGVSLGAAAVVSLWGPNLGAIQGNYSASLVAQFNASQNQPPPTQSAAIGQTGQIPPNAQTLIFWASPGNS